jgi:uncharacterized iron-regulated membrane protein
MAWLHTWAGLLPGWVLFTIFVFGSSAFFQYEISAWMRPELHSAPVTRRAIKAADTILRQRAGGATNWTLTLPNARGGDGLALAWQMPKGEGGEVKLDPATGRELALRDTQGGYFLYRFHFDLYYVPWWVARYLVSISALAMLVAILSGIVTHKKIFADFFQLRFGKGQRSWLDAHNVTGVLALPFHIMITYTGLVALLFTLMPWGVAANFRDEQAFYDAAYPGAPPMEPSGKPAPVAPLAELIGRAERNWGGVPPSYIEVARPGDSTAVVTLYPAKSDWPSQPRDAIFLNAVSGEASPGGEKPRGGGLATQAIMIDLHTGWFAGSTLRWLYFLGGVVGTVMCATGLVLWTVKRRARLPDPERPHFGFRLVERSNIGFIAGAPGGVAVYLLANRLLPFGMAQRAEWEINSLFIAWGAIFAWTLGRPARRAWIEALSACAALFVLVPLVNAATTSRGLVSSLLARDWVFVGVDLTVLAIGVGFAMAARHVAKSGRRGVTLRRKAPREAVS